MSDDPTKAPGDIGETISNGMAGVKVVDLSGFKSTGGNFNDRPGSTSKKKGKPGPKPKNYRGDRPGDSGQNQGAAGPSLDDDEMAANRAELEALLRELLVSTTDDWADYRFTLFRKIADDELARMLADKKRLTDTEKKLFPKMVVRLCEKYVGGGFEYSDEIMTTAMVINYFLRNREGDKLEKEARGPKTDKRSGVQSTPVSDPGDIGHGKNGTGRQISLAPSGPV